jgi:hypothetical protein
VRQIDTLDGIIRHKYLNARRRVAGHDVLRANVVYDSARNLYAIFCTCGWTFEVTTLEVATYLSSDGWRGRLADSFLAGWDLHIEAAEKRRRTWAPTFSIPLPDWCA